MGDKNQYKKKVEFGQDVYDLCLQEYGSLNTLFLLLADNPSLDLKRQLVAGEEIKLRIVLPADVSVNKNLMDDYRNNQTRVNNHDEIETLEDGCAILTSNGDSLFTSDGFGIFLQGCEIEAEDELGVLSGFLTSDGDVIVTSSLEIILPEKEPVLGTELGFSILTAQGEEIGVCPQELEYITTNDGFFLQTAQGDFLIL